jgi:hypothetical protein
MIKIKTAGQILPFEKRHGFAQSISSAWFAVLYVFKDGFKEVNVPKKLSSISFLGYQI